MSQHRDLRGSGIANPNGLKFDSSGRVVIADNRGPVAFSTGGNPSILFNVGVFNGVLAIDTNDDIYTGGSDGVIRVHAADGTFPMHPFTAAFLVVAAISAASALWFWRLPADAGAEMSGREPAKTKAAESAEPIAAAETSDRRIG